MKKILSILFISSSLVFAGNNDIGLDTIVGGTIGVIIGNQIGRGTGKDVARVAGGLLGASIANNTRDSRNNNNYNNYNNDNYRNDNYRNNSYNNYERTTTYVRQDYYDDRYYYERRQPSQVVVIYNDYDRRPPYRDYHGHHDGPRGYGYQERRYMGR